MPPIFKLNKIAFICTLLIIAALSLIDGPGSSSLILREHIRNLDEEVDLSSTAASGNTTTSNNTSPAEKPAVEDAAPIEKVAEEEETNTTESEEASEEDNEPEFVDMSEIDFDSEEKKLQEKVKNNVKSPSIILLEPKAREGTDRAANNKGPCGSAQKAETHYLSRSGSRNWVSWRTIKSSPTANCTVKLGVGTDDDEFKVLHPRDGTSDINGKFPCGRAAGYDGKEFKFPKTLTCESCTLQLEWELPNKEVIHQCADLVILDRDPEHMSCAGACSNGGVCSNGECVCRKGYIGDYCQHQDSALYNTAWWLILFSIIIALTAGLYYGAMKYKQKIRENQGAIYGYDKKPTGESEHSHGQGNHAHHQ